MFTQHIHIDQCVYINAYMHIYVYVCMYIYTHLNIFLNSYIEFSYSHFKSDSPMTLRYTIMLLAHHNNWVYYRRVYRKKLYTLRKVMSSFLT